MPTASGFGLGNYVTTINWGKSKLFHKRRRAADANETWKKSSNPLQKSKINNLENKNKNFNTNINDLNENESILSASSKLSVKSMKNYVELKKKPHFGNIDDAESEKNYANPNLLKHSELSISSETIDPADGKKDLKENDKLQAQKKNVNKAMPVTKTKKVLKTQSLKNPKENLKKEPLRKNKIRESFQSKDADMEALNKVNYVNTKNIKNKNFLTNFDALEIEYDNESIQLNNNIISERRDRNSMWTNMKANGVDKENAKKNSVAKNFNTNVKSMTKGLKQFKNNSLDKKLDKTNIVLEIKSTKDHPVETIDQIQFIKNLRSNSIQSLYNLHSIRDNTEFNFANRSYIDDPSLINHLDSNFVNVNRRPLHTKNNLKENIGVKTQRNYLFTNSKETKQLISDQKSLAHDSDDSLVFTETSSLSDNENDKIKEKSSRNKKIAKKKKQEIFDRTKTPSSESSDDSADGDHLKIDQKGDLKFFIKPRQVNTVKETTENIEDDEIDEDKLRELVSKLIKSKKKKENPNLPPAVAKTQVKNKKTVKTEQTTGDKGYTIYLDKSGTGGGLGDNALPNISSLLNQSKNINQNMASTFYTADDSELNYTNNLKNVNNINNLSNRGYNKNNGFIENNRNNQIKNKNQNIPLNNYGNNRVDVQSNQTIPIPVNESLKTTVNEGWNQTSFADYSQRNNNETFQQRHNIAEQSTKFNAMQYVSPSRIEMKSIETTTSDLIGKQNQLTQTHSEQQTQTETIKDFATLQTQTDGKFLSNVIDTTKALQQTKSTVQTSQKIILPTHATQNTLVSPNTNHRLYRILVTSPQLRYSLEPPRRPILPLLHSDQQQKVKFVVRSPKNQYISAPQLDSNNNTNYSGNQNNIKTDNIGQTKRNNEFVIVENDKNSKRKIFQNIRRPVKFINKDFFE